MLPLAAPEVLADEWYPLQPIARTRECAALRGLVRPGAAREPAPPTLIEGPPGSGTSLLARWAARLLADATRATGGSPAVRVSVRTRWCAGTTGVAGALLRHFDEGFHERGFSIAEIMAGFLRRSFREPGPLVVVLDDLSAGGPAIGPIVRALQAPDRFLPEGTNGPHPIQVVLAGHAGAWGARAQLAREGVSIGAVVTVPAYTSEELGAILADRAERALGRPAPPELIGSVVRRALGDGRGAGRAVELLRHALLPPPSRPRPRAGPEAESARLREVEPHVLAAIGSACATGPAELADVRATEARLALDQGRPPLAATTFWRRIVRLEQAGFIGRSVRAGGPGGSRSSLRLLRPLPSGPPFTSPTGTPPACGPSASSFGVAGRPGGRPGPGWALPRWSGWAAPGAVGRGPAPRATKS